DLRDRYADRTAVAASLIDSLFNVAFTAQRGQAAERYGGPSIPRERLDAVAKQGQLAYTMIVDARGRVISASSNAPSAVDPAVLRTALKGGVGLSGSPSGRPPVIQSAIAFRTPSGPRVQVNGSPTKAFVTFLSGTLKPLPTLTGSRAFVLDARGGSLGAARQGGRPLPPSPEMRAAIAGKMR